MRGNPRDRWKPRFSADRPDLKHRLDVVRGLVQRSEEYLDAAVEQVEETRTA